MTRSSGSGSNSSPFNQNTLDINDGKKNLDFYHTIIDWKQNTDVVRQPAEHSASISDNDNNDYSYNGETAVAPGLYNFRCIWLIFGCGNGKIAHICLFTDDGKDGNDGDADDDDDDVEDDLDYNGSSSSGSDSIVIKIASTNADSPKSIVDREAATTTSSATTITTTTMAPAPDSAITNESMFNVAAAASSKTQNYNYNDEHYHFKDDASTLNDVNSNRPNLRRSSNNNNVIRSNAYEERNIYVSNNGLSDNANGGNDSTKSYIHIEVYKGNLDNGDDSSSINTATAKPKEIKPMADGSAIVHAGTEAVSHLHPNNNASPDSMTELSSTTTKT